MKIFSKNIITKDEISAIEQWSDDSSDIKMSMWLNKPNSEAKILFGLFDKYKSNVKSGVKLYRGMSLDKNMYKLFGYDLLQQGDLYTPDNSAIVSFSRDKKVAFEFANATNNEYKIIIKTVSKNKNMIDISNISLKTDEKETIFTNNLWYNVKNIKRSGQWLLMIIEER